MEADGFTLVSEGDKNAARIEKDEDPDRIAALAKKRRKKKAKELKDFYRHQMREEKRNALARLRVQFAQDKERVEEMRRRRKFKV